MNVHQYGPEPIEFGGVELHLCLEDVGGLGDHGGKYARAHATREVNRGGVGTVQ